MSIRLEARNRGNIRLDMDNASLAAKYAREAGAAEKAAELSAANAAGAAERADAAAEAALRAKAGAQSAAVHLPQPGENGTWLVWDQAGDSYVDSGANCTGVQGERGLKGETGDKGDKGDTGSKGDDGASPTVTVTDITGGHRVTITDANHPQGQPFDVMDGEVAQEDFDELSGDVDDLKSAVSHIESQFPDINGVILPPPFEIGIRYLDNNNHEAWSGGDIRGMSFMRGTYITLKAGDAITIDSNIIRVFGGGYSTDNGATFIGISASTSYIAPSDGLYFFWLRKVNDAVFTEIDLRDGWTYIKFNRSDSIEESVETCTNDIAMSAHDWSLVEQGKQSFYGFGNFDHYGLDTDGEFLLSQKYRVSNNNRMTFDRGLTVSIASGFRAGYVAFDNNTATWHGWYTTQFNIPKGIAFNLQIARVSEITTEVANVAEFVNAVSFVSNNALANYAGLVYSGKPTNNAILFTTENVSAGDVLYYSMETSVEQQMGVLLMDSNNNQIGFFGRKHPHAGWLKYEGAIIVPEGFHHAIAQVTEAGTVKINYVCKNPSPEMIKTHMSNMLNAYNFYSLPYISVGYRLRISDGKPVSNNAYSITGFYSVLPGDLVCVSDFIGGGTYGIGCYDVNQDYLYGIPSSMETMTLIVPDNVFYLRYTVLNANEHQIVNIYRGNEIVEKCGHLYNKRCITFGDSLSNWDSKVFTFGRDNGSYCIGYQSYMRRAGMIVTNAGVAGDDATEINPRIKATDFTDFDMVTINCGGNDSKDKVPLGELAPIGSTFDVTTFYGALQDAIEYILGNNQSIQIVLITPLKGTFYTDTEVTEVKTQFVTAFKEIGSLYAIPVCDWHNNSGINKLNFETYINDLPESHNYLCHPNNAGYQRIANILIPFLKSLYTDSIYFAKRA